MAIFHCSVKIIGRSGGRSAVSAAAYRSGEKLVDQETGIVVDYTRKGGVVYSEIDLPEHSPEEYKDRETLWNAVEKVESKANSQLAREVEVALPKEFPREMQIEVLREFIYENFVLKGMIADWSIHVPSKNTENPHCHIMLTTRGFKENGEWDSKEKKTWKLDENGERIPVIDPTTGQQKIDARGRKLWEREYVQKNDWNDRRHVEEWRASWADVCNGRLVAIDLDPIDHRSFKRQGLEIEPTIHEGYVARQMEARGVTADRCEINREILVRRSLIQDVVEKIKDVAIKLKDAVLEKLGRVGEKIERYGYDLNFEENRTTRDNTREARTENSKAEGRIITEGHDNIDTFLAGLEAKECHAEEERLDRDFKIKRSEVGASAVTREGEPGEIEDGRIFRGGGKIDMGL